ncbi:MAG: TfoX/Sxy family protein [Rickettsiales bacterium]|jgi:TfoX/Sxy family transcriptional regulator of competence genes|nr:TfoX/Sxy family protein [Rickettsiales bacterium]
MATNKDFFDYALGQLAEAGGITGRKMFGEYAIYKDGKMIILVCDNTLFVKILPEAAAVFAKHGRVPDTGRPYDGAKEHYIADVDDKELCLDLAAEMYRVLPMPKPRAQKKPRARADA